MSLAALAAALVVAVIGAILFVTLLRITLVQSLDSAADSQLDTVEAQLRNGATDDEAVVSGVRDIIVQIIRDGQLSATDKPQVSEPVRTTPGTWTEVHIEGLEDPFVVHVRSVDPHTLILVGVSQEQVGDATGATALLLVVAVPIALALLAVALWLTIGRALRPVEEMRAQAATITSEHLHRRLAVPPGADEIPRLASTLNQMLDRIDAGHQLQRQFVSDASHELRSPLASMRQLAEVARRYPDRVSAAALADDVLAEERRMEELVTALLTLARSEGAGGVRQEVDVDDLVLAEVAREESGVPPRIDVSGVGAGRVLGDPVLVSRAVRNLIANARRHARERVVVELEERDGTVSLAVHDDGVGIPVADRERVFERFVRLDEARAREDGGAGLGLAIVRKVVEGMGGTVSVGEGPLGGALLVVSIPAADEE
ncbi:MAG: ATP-binding protein [Nocardioides sp.]|uniref:HAMP domain-containing sensor histidine kinase n=1 Tax=Nocardioides sp. TaxID=35761 RepID=UPI0039E6C288